MNGTISFHGVDAVVFEPARNLPGGGSVRSMYVVAADGTRMEIILHGASGPVAVTEGDHMDAIELSCDNARQFAQTS